jgi:hypothetical protein
MRSGSCSSLASRSRVLSGMRYEGSMRGQFISGFPTIEEQWAGLEDHMYNAAGRKPGEWVEQMIESVSESIWGQHGSSGLPYRTEWLQTRGLEDDVLSQALTENGESAQRMVCRMGEKGHCVHHTRIHACVLGSHDSSSAFMKKNAHRSWASIPETPRAPDAYTHRQGLICTRTSSRRASSPDTYDEEGASTSSRSRRINAVGEDLMNYYVRHSDVNYNQAVLHTAASRIQSFARGSMVRARLTLQGRTDCIHHNSGSSMHSSSGKFSNSGRFSGSFGQRMLLFK